jgi:hypothetical protein
MSRLLDATRATRGSFIVLCFASGALTVSNLAGLASFPPSALPGVSKPMPDAAGCTPEALDRVALQLNTAGVVASGSAHTWLWRDLPGVAPMRVICEQTTDEVITVLRMPAPSGLPDPGPAAAARLSTMLGARAEVSTVLADTPEVYEAVEPTRIRVVSVDRAAGKLSVFERRLAGAAWWLATFSAPGALGVVWAATAAVGAAAWALSRWSGRSVVRPA